MREQDTYARARELHKILPPISEEEAQGLVKTTVKDLEIMCLQSLTDERTREMLRRNSGLFDKKPEPTFLSAFSVFVIAGRFLEEFGDREQHLGHYRVEKAHRDAHVGLSAITIPFTDATHPSQEITRVSRSGILDFKYRELLEEKVSLIKLSLSSDPTGFTAIDGLVYALRFNWQDVCPTFANAGAELAQRYYKGLYPLAEQMLKN